MNFELQPSENSIAGLNPVDLSATFFSDFPGPHRQRRFQPRLNSEERSGQLSSPFGNTDFAIYRTIPADTGCSGTS